MPRLFGPDTFGETFDDDDRPLDVDAATLGEALAAYERAFDVSLTPYDGRYPNVRLDPADPKYFIYKSKRPKWEETLVDIHVERDGVSICARQDLAFPLHADDVIHIGILVC